MKSMTQVSTRTYLRVAAVILLPTALCCVKAIWDVEVVNKAIEDYRQTKLERKSSVSDENLTGELKPEFLSTYRPPCKHCDLKAPPGAAPDPHDAAVQKACYDALVAIVVAPPQEYDETLKADWKNVCTMIVNESLGIEDLCAKCRSDIASQFLAKVSHLHRYKSITVTLQRWVNWCQTELMLGEQLKKIQSGGITALPAPAEASGNVLVAPLPSRWNARLVIRVARQLIAGAAIKHGQNLYELARNELSLAFPTYGNTAFTHALYAECLLARLVDAAATGLTPALLEEIKATPPQFFTSTILPSFVHQVFYYLRHGDFLLQNKLKTSKDIELELTSLCRSAANHITADRYKAIFPGLYDAGCTPAVLANLLLQYYSGRIRPSLRQAKGGVAVP